MLFRSGAVLVIITISLTTTHHQTVPAGSESGQIMPVTGQTTPDIHLSQPRIREIRGNFYVILNGFDELKEFSPTGHAQPRHLHIYPPNVK